MRLNDTTTVLVQAYSPVNATFIIRYSKYVCSFYNKMYSSMLKSVYSFILVNKKIVKIVFTWIFLLHSGQSPYNHLLTCHYVVSSSVMKQENNSERLRILRWVPVPTVGFLFLRRRNTPYSVLHILPL